MEHEFWHRKWETNEIGFHQEAFNPHLVKHFSVLQLAGGSCVFVPLCGKTRDIHWLLDQGFRVVGVELSELAVQQLFANLSLTPEIENVGALRRYRAPGLDVLVGDFFALSPDLVGEIDAVYDRAALVALPPAMRDQYAAHLTRLAAGASQLLVSFAYDQHAMPGPPFCVPGDEVTGHYGAEYHIRLLDSVPVEGGLKGVCAADEQVWLLQAAG